MGRKGVGEVDRVPPPPPPPLSASPMREGEGVEEGGAEGPRILGVEEGHVEGVVERVRLEVDSRVPSGPEGVESGVELGKYGVLDTLRVA